MTADIARYHYRAFHEQLYTCYFVTVKLYKYGWFGLRYRVASRSGRSRIADGRWGIQEEQARLKSEMLEELNLEPATV